MLKLINILILTAFIYIFSFNNLHDYNGKLNTTTIIENNNIIFNYTSTEKEIINLLTLNSNQLTTIINKNISLPKDYIP